MPYQLQSEVNKLINIAGFVGYEPLTGQLLAKENTLKFLGIDKKASIISVDRMRNVAPGKIKYPQMGYGSDIVYVIYSTAMRTEAILKKWDIWPLKVGKTNNLERRLKQLSESGPNSLCVGLVMYTNNPFLLEQYIHKNLTDRGQFLRIPGRKEWFNSNLDQIRSLYNNYQSQGLI